MTKQPSIQTDQGIIHQWIYTMVPVADYANHDQIIFTGFCKACRTYFTETVPYSFTRSETSPSTLPRYGCKPISDDVSALG